MPAAGSKPAHANSAERDFFQHFGSALWLFSREFPELVHALTRAIDSDLLTPSEHTHLLLASKASWVEVQGGP
jgi:hypothetical protein